MNPRISISGIPIDNFTVESLHEEITKTIRKKKKKVFLHANARLIELANTKEKWLIDYFNCDDKFVMCDGAGIQLAARIGGLPMPTKIPYNIWMWDLFKFVSLNGFRIYFLGSDRETIRKAAQKAITAEPDLLLVGFHDGYFVKEKDHVENRTVIDRINGSNVDILLVGFGMPKQEQWVRDNIESLNVGVIFTCGGAFDFISGKRSVAPLFFRRLYLEWLFRFLLEPIRLFERAFVSNFRFMRIVLKKKLFENRKQ